PDTSAPSAEGDDEWPEPLDLFNAAPVAPYSYESVPGIIADFARGVTDAMGFDRSGTIVAAVTAGAAMIDDRHRLLVRGKSEWGESARLWSVLIAPAGGGKSPVIKAATRELKAMQNAWGKARADARAAAKAAAKKP